MNDGKIKTVKVKHPESPNHFLIVNEADAENYTVVEEKPDKPEAKKEEPAKEEVTEQKPEEEKPTRRRGGPHVGQ